MRVTAFFKYSALLLTLLVLWGCGGKNVNIAPSASEEALKKTPKWFLDPPSESSYLYTTATATLRDMQAAVSKAEVRGRTELGKQMETRLANLTKDFQEETGVDSDSELIQSFNTATKTVTNQIIVGSSTEKKELVPEKGIYRAYVLMSLPIGPANELLMEKIKDNENLYTQFRSSKAFDELSKEIEALKNQ